MKQGRTVLEAKRFGCYSCFPDTPLVDAVKKMVAEDSAASSSSIMTAIWRASSRATMWCAATWRMTTGSAWRWASI